MNPLLEIYLTFLPFNYQSFNIYGNTQDVLIEFFLWDFDDFLNYSHISIGTLYTFYSQAS